jgi:enoyl-CoA hydratase/carnithine racemase
MLQYDVTDHIATITLDRPEVKNALNRELYARLEQAFLHAHADPEVRCVIVTGAGSAFCSGDDVRELMLNPSAQTPAVRQRDPNPRPTPAAMAVLECDKPVIAAVNGAAVGWGMDLTLFCDIRIASDRAKFGELFIKRGLVSDMGGLWRLPQIVGPSKAAELLFTGYIIDAA